jgi:hypothetical protein
MYAFVQDVPIDAEFYRRIVEGLGDETPDGLISHLAYELPDGGLRYVDVWESEAHWDRFAEARLHPVVHPLLKGIFGEGLPPEPPRITLAAIDHWGPAGHQSFASSMRS